MRPDVSVIIPFYEGNKWIRGSVQSVFAEEGISREVIVVDDGSKEEPTMALQPFADIPQMQLVRIEHAGKGAALNAGVAAAAADVVCFLDQDDLMSPGRLSLQYKIFLEDQHVDAVYSDYQRVRDDGRIIDTFISRQGSRKELIRQMARSVSLVSMQTIMMKKTLFNALGGFSTDIQLTGLDDAEFFIRLFTSQAELRYVPGVVQKWVLHGANYSESADFQNTRLILLKYLEAQALRSPHVRKELPHFKYHAFFMRGLYFLERGMPAEAVKEYSRAVQVQPLNINGYYLLLKSMFKKAVNASK
jgi:glycosyltransferase involved in cell wall biosynthesis